MDYKTPGVFVEEVALFPPSVAAVATAIPAFVGHTQMTTEPSGKSLINRPVRLTSFLEFTSLFGGGYNPAAYSVQLGPAPVFPILTITPANNRKFYLYDSLRHYFDNGGGPLLCCICRKFFNRCDLRYRYDRPARRFESAGEGR